MNNQKNKGLYVSELVNFGILL